MNSSPKVKITRTEPRDYPGTAKARDLLDQIGKLLAPDNMDFQGSFSVYFYKDKNQELYAFLAQQRNMHNIPEQQADAGFKELMRAVMGVYGRKMPAVVGDA